VASESNFVVSDFGDLAGAEFEILRVLFSPAQFRLDAIGQSGIWIDVGDVRYFPNESRGCCLNATK
jgi:hypothetical protein